MSAERIESIRARRKELDRTYNALADEKEMLEKRMAEITKEDEALFAELQPLLHKEAQ